MEKQHHDHQQTRRVSVRKYHQIWEGKNVLLCRGKYMIGASAQPVIYTLMLINVPSFLEEFLVIGRFDGATFVGTLVPFIILHVFANFFMLRTILTDPGIIRRYNEKYVDSEDLSHIPQRKMQALAKRNPCEMTLNNHLMRFKYCRTCHIYRPPRSTHCHECDNCVERFDHHCPWLGVCVGKRNYRNFFMFIFTTTILIGLSIFISLYRILTTWQDESPDDFGGYLKKEPYTIISLAYCFLFSLFLGPLFLFHLWLIKHNMTTNEFWKNTWKKLGVNPYKKKNFASNCFAIMCLPIRASFVQLKKVMYPYRIPTPDQEAKSFNKIEIANQVTGDHDRFPGQYSPDPFIQRKESDKSNTATNLGQYDSKEENDLGMNGANSKTPPSSAGNPSGEVNMFNPQAMAKGVTVRNINTNKFVYSMQGEPVEIVARNSQQESSSKGKINEDLDNEKSPLSGYIEMEQAKKRNKRMNSGSVHESPDMYYSRNNSARRVGQEM